jgi:hypothetical protein
MKKSILIVATLFLAVLCLSINAQNLSVTFAPTSITPSNSPVTDELVTLDQEVQQLQAQVDQQVHFKTQSSRIAYYETLHKLAVTKAAYYNVLASTNPETGYLAKQTAWQLNQQASVLQNKLYAMSEASPPSVTHAGKSQLQ